MTAPIYRRTYAAQQLMADHPPRPQDANKRLVFALTCPPDAHHAGEIHASRWPTAALPSTVARSADGPTLELHADFFRYAPSKPGWAEWHLNFAHREAFAFYGGPLFAQDEMQVTEHPALASVRYALLAEGLPAQTNQPDGPTPILVAGVERRCVVATDRNPGEGRPYGLYGNNFARADRAAVEQATRLLAPPTLSNILAMEAPANGRGHYSEDEIRHILSTAYTGFAATLAETRHLHGADVQVAVHTGFWGCGAYGGNRVLMPLLQMIAAAAAEIDALVFHAGPDSAPYMEARQLLNDLLPVGASVPVDKLVEQILGMGFAWGVGDGT